MNLIFDFLWVLVTLAAIILVVVVIILVTLTVRNRSESKLSGQSPGPQVDSAEPTVGTPAERLHELGIRRSTRQITAEEYAAAREEILREL